jgi:hypothetical protein
VFGSLTDVSPFEYNVKYPPLDSLPISQFKIAIASPAFHDINGGLDEGRTKPESETTSFKEL